MSRRESLVEVGSRRREHVFRTSHAVRDNEGPFWETGQHIDVKEIRSEVRITKHDVRSGSKQPKPLSSAVPVARTRSVILSCINVAQFFLVKLQN